MRRRQHDERIEPIAELFSDLDGSIDAREDDYEQKAAIQNSPVSTVWKKHRSATTPPKGMDQYADQLYTDVVDLQTDISELAFPPSKVVGGAAGLIQEVGQPAKSAVKKIATATPICGISRLTSQSCKIVDLLRPQLQTIWHLLAKTHQL